MTGQTRFWIFLGLFVAALASAWVYAMDWAGQGMGFLGVVCMLGAIAVARNDL